MLVTLQDYSESLHCLVEPGSRFKVGHGEEKIKLLRPLSSPLFTVQYAAMWCLMICLTLVNCTGELREESVLTSNLSSILKDNIRSYGIIQSFHALLDEWNGAIIEGQGQSIVTKARNYFTQYNDRGRELT